MACTRIENAGVSKQFIHAIAIKIAKLIELYREMRDRHAILRSQVQTSLEQADRGDVAPLDFDAIKAQLRNEHPEFDTQA